MTNYSKHIYISISKSSLLIIVLFLFAFLLRVALLNAGYHVDILSNAPWGKWIYDFGPKNFYESQGWILSSPTQPPIVNLVYGYLFNIYQYLNWLFIQISSFIAFNHLGAGHLIWWFDFVKWFGTATYPVTEIQIGYLIIIKLFAVLFDLGLGFIIYKLSKSVRPDLALLFAGAYLLLPFSWYISALWGQYDQAGFFLALVAFLLLVKKNYYFSPVMLLLSLGIKPTSLIFLPFFAYLYIKGKPGIKEIILGLSLSIIIFVVSTKVFTEQNLIHFMTNDLYRAIFQKAEYRVSTNAFNFWHILVGNQALNQNTPFLFVPAKIWGYGAFLILNILAFKLYDLFSRKGTDGKKIEGLVCGLFVISAGSWLFMTNMLERYFFAGIVSGLLVCIYKPSLFKYWIILSLLFWVNLYHGWWFPSSINSVHKILIWQDGLMTRVISVLILFLFLWFIAKIIPKQLMINSLKVFKKRLDTSFLNLRVKDQLKS